MGDFTRCIRHILNEEGGYVNHAKDPGGETKYGISKRAYPQLDIPNLTLEEAEKIYKRDYWEPVLGNQWPDGLALLLFDTAVNMGVKTAIVLLQKTLNVEQDGIIGPVTRLAAQKHMPFLLNSFCAERTLRYAMNKNLETFGRGWFRRLFRMYGFALALSFPEKPSLSIPPNSGDDHGA